MLDFARIARARVESAIEEWRALGKEISWLKNTKCTCQPGCTGCNRCEKLQRLFEERQKLVNRFTDYREEEDNDHSR
jgi:hypothetical protein